VKANEKAGDFILRPATGSELPAVVGLLEAAGLPAAGLERHVETLFVLARGGSTVGAVGLEAYPSAALLRSLVVAPGTRGEGWGRRLAELVMEEARRRGFREAYALTNSIPDLLLRLGFEEVSRRELPEALLASKELQGACPASARVFRKRLAGG
jgi:amino-acid N-acetyltransferase